MVKSVKWWIGFNLLLLNLATADEASDFEKVQAEFHAGLYQQAVPKLEALLKMDTERRKPLIRTELAYAYLQSGQSKKAEALLENCSLAPEEHYLLGSAYQINHKPTKAIAAFKSYLEMEEEALQFRDHAEFQLGQVLLEDHQPALAERHFLAVTFDPDQPDLFVTARIECARLAFAQGKRTLAEERLSPIADLLAPNHPLIHKYAFVYGDLLVQAQEYANAIPWLEKALPKKNSDKADWADETLYDLGLAYMHLDGHRTENLERAQNYLQTLFQSSPCEKSALALGRCLHLQAKVLKDLSYYEKAEKLLSLPGLFKSSEGKAQALLLRADAAPPDQAQKLFEQALPYFHETHKSDATAFLYGVAALRLSEHNSDYAGLADVPEVLEAGLAYAPNGQYAPALLLLLGSYHQARSNHLKAEEALKKLTGQYPKSAEAAEGWFRLSKSAQALGKDPETYRTYRRFVYEQFPDSAIAAEAYFTTYSYQDYLQGGRNAMHHLDAMPMRYPQSPYTLNALYLTGLDSLKDRKTPEGRWIRKKSLTAAIDAFHRCETLFDDLKQKELIPPSYLEYYTHLRHRAVLERALANYAIAEASSGAKRQIYLDYAIEVFVKLRQQLNAETHATLLEEGEYGLIQAYLKARSDKQAETVMEEMLARYDRLGNQQSYYLSRIWTEKGALAMRKELYREALQAYEKADIAGQGGLLSPDQLLDIWISQSLCLRALGDLDQAMLLLSKVINENVVSGLRIKAMVLRAEIYELQGRKDLARNQLESASKKGGEWGAKAKDKLKNGYYYE